MNIEIINAEAVYRRLLAEPDAAQREAIYREALVTPFAGLLNVFGGGGDALTQFAQWGMSIDLFDDERRLSTAALIETLAAHDAWGQFAQATRDAQATFAPYADHIPLGTFKPRFWSAT